MKTTIRKTACAVLAASLFFGVTACAATEETEKTEKTEETTEETTEESSDVDTDEILDIVEDYCDAIAGTDGEAIVALSTDDLEGADEVITYLDFDGCTAYSSDMGDILSVIADTITYEIDEDSLEVGDDGDTAEVDVVFNMFSYLGEADEDFADIDAFAAYVENGETSDVPVTVSLALTDDGWRVSNTEDLLDNVYDFMIMAALAPDFTFGEESGEANGDEPTVTVTGDEPVLTFIDREWYEEVGTYPDVEYAPSYIARLTYADYEIDFSGFSGSGISDWDFDAHTGTVEAGDSFDISLSYSCDIDDPDLEGFIFVIDYNDEITIEDAEDLAISVDAASAGNCTVALEDPWGRIIWAGYIEVV